ncbi:MAG: diacylglycerol kinase family protein [Firmicutes bacterium]|nr:diacylglycerol kinase family protein [Bacillota bacterium]
METKNKSNEIFINGRKVYSMKKSFLNAVAGIVYCVRTQRNVPVIFGFALLVLLFSWLFKISTVELLFVFTAIFLVIITEVINTAIERAIDLVSKEYHTLARISKDAAAGAVLIAVIYSILCGLIIFLPKAISSIGSLLQK